MKKMLILLLISGVAFSACKKNGDDNDDDNNNNNQETKKITILEVRSIDWTDSRGETWDDDGTGPDLQVKFGPANQPEKYSTGIRNDPAPQHGAIKLNLDPKISTTKEIWSFKLYDIDNFGDDRVMYTWTHDFTATPSNTVDKQEGDWFLRIHLED